MHVECAAIGFADLAADWQAYAAALNNVAGLQRCEQIKYSVMVFCIDPGAIIGHRNLDPIVVRSSPDRDMSAIPMVMFDRI